jgi:hypothetical protein
MLKELIIKMSSDSTILYTAQGNATQNFQLQNKQFLENNNEETSLINVAFRHVSVTVMTLTVVQPP